MGDENPAGNAVFQATFLPGPISEGRFRASATPVPLGPRNRGQSAAIRGTAMRRSRTRCCIELVRRRSLGDRLAMRSMARGCRDRCSTKRSQLGEVDCLQGLARLRLVVGAISGKRSLTVAPRFGVYAFRVYVFGVRVLRMYVLGAFEACVGYLGFAA